MNDTETQERIVEYWSVDGDAERLTAGTKEEAVLEWLDGQHPSIVPTRGELAVYGFARRVISAGARKRLVQDVIEMLLERLDEEYGSDEDASDCTDEQRAAAVAFIDQFTRAYKVWQCEEVQQDVVPLIEWHPQ